LELKPCLYFGLAPQHEPPLPAHVPPQMDEAFILDALAIVLFFVTTGGDLE